MLVIISYFVTVLLAIWVLLITLSVFDNTFNIFVGIIIILSFLVHFIGVTFSEQYQAMDNMTDVEGGLVFAKEMRSTAPTLSLNVSCYHYETRRHTTHSKGKSHTTTTRVRVTTFSAVNHIPIPFWCDLTPPLLLPNNRLLIHVKTRPMITWLHGSELVIEMLRSRLYETNKHRDTNCEVHKNEVIPGLISERMILNGKKKKVPMIFRGFLRLLVNLFSFGLANAYYIASVAPVEHFTVTKYSSLKEPVVTQAFCAAYNIPYASIVPSAPLITQPGGYTFVTGNETDYAVSPPCLQNPYPVMTAEQFQMGNPQEGAMPSAPPMEVEVQTQPQVVELEMVEAPPIYSEV
jgi:hypothetical protein